MRLKALRLWGIRGVGLRVQTVSRVYLRTLGLLGLAGDKAKFYKLSDRFRV